MRWFYSLLTRMYMKLFFPVAIFILVLISSISCSKVSRNKKIVIEDTAVMYFAKKEFNFGSISSGMDVKHDFFVFNHGRTNLIIYNVITTCGCTIASFQSNPIPPGHAGIITINFNSLGKYGKILKIITVKSNAKPATQDLRMYGFVND